MSHPENPKIGLFCDILVHIPSSISTHFALFTSTFLSVIDHILNLLCLCKIKKNVSSFMTYPESLKIGLFVKFSSIFLAVFGHILHFLQRYSYQYLITFRTLYAFARSKKLFLRLFSTLKPLKIGHVVKFQSIFQVVFGRILHFLRPHSYQ